MFELRFVEHVLLPFGKYCDGVASFPFVLSNVNAVSSKSFSWISGPFVGSNRVASAPGFRRKSGFAERASAATPTAFGDAIDVPCSQPKPLPETLKQAKLNSEDSAGSVQISPDASRAPSEPKPP